MADPILVKLLAEAALQAALIVDWAMFSCSAVLDMLCVFESIKNISRSEMSYILCFTSLIDMKKTNN